MFSTYCHKWSMWTYFYHVYFYVLGILFLGFLLLSYYTALIFFWSLVSILFMILFVVRLMYSKTVLIRDWVQLPEIENHPDLDSLYSWNRKSEQSTAVPHGPPLSSVTLSIRLSSHGGFSIPEDGCISAFPFTFQTGTKINK